MTVRLHHMQTIRKNIARRPWLVATLGFMLLAQMQQAVACGLMKITPVEPGQHCQKHGSGMQQMEQAQKAHCDLVFAFSGAGPCHNDHGAAINPSPLNPDSQPALITVSLQNIFPYPQSPPLVLVPDRELSRAGTQTYLITQRLRI